jgi:uncharacterized phiE125 gp8 family phage protein
VSLNLQVVTAPALEALTLEEAKAHVRVELDNTDEDDYLRGLIRTATRMARDGTSKALLTQTLALRLDRFPCTEIYLPCPPLQSVSSITYLDTSNVLQTLAATKYQVVGARATPDELAPDGYVRPSYGNAWPTTYPVPECVVITYVAGWASAEAVPDGIKRGMLELIGDLYAQREQTMVGETVAVIGKAKELFDNDRCYRAFDY